MRNQLGITSTLVHCVAWGLIVGCIPNGNKPPESQENTLMKVDPEKTPRPLRCIVISHDTERELRGGQVEEPWRLYLSIRNSPHLTLIEPDEEKLAEDNLMYFFVGDAPDEKSRYQLRHYELAKFVKIDQRGLFAVPAPLEKSLASFFKKIQSEDMAPDDRVKSAE